MVVSDSPDLDQDAWLPDLATVLSHRLLNTLCLSTFALDRLERSAPVLTDEEHDAALRDIAEGLEQAASLAHLLVGRPAADEQPIATARRGAPGAGGDPAV